MTSNYHLTLMLLLCCVCPQTYAAKAEVTWLYSEPVTFISNHDVARIKLENHPTIDLDDVIYHSDPISAPTPIATPQSLTFDEVNQWKSGREINIAYSSTCGAVLLDPRSGKYIEIIHGLKTHPLECVYQNKVGGGSTMEMVIAANEIIDLWKLEIARIYDRLRLEFPNDKDVFNTAESQWKHHCDADLQASRLTSNKEGTIHLIISASDRIALYHNHALRLARWGRM